MQKKPESVQFVRNKDDNEALVEEVRRVLKLTPEIEIPEFREKTVEVVVEFVLEE